MAHFKVRILLLLSFFFLPVISLVAQNKGQKVTLNVQSVQLSEVFAKIERQTTFRFSYRSEALKGQKPVSFKCQAIPVPEALKQILAGRELSFSIVSDKSIVVTAIQSKAPSEIIRGNIWDDQNQPLPGAAVLIQGTTIGASADMDGRFEIKAKEGDILNVVCFGYETYEFIVGDKTDYKIVLEPEAVDLAGVVVTALGIRRSEKAVSYNVQQVKESDLITVKDANFINSLSGKIAGVNINASSSGVGGASKVVMRGTKAIEQSNNALYVIDGVPIYNFSKTAGTENASEGSSESIADINPEDIESVSVLTGAAAAALYGSNASNGAIVITTKKGKEGKTTVTFSSNTELSSPFVMPEFQNRYGTGVIGSPVKIAQKSWGTLLNSANRTGYKPQKDYFKTGFTATEAFSVSSGTEKNQTYFSASAVNSKGIIPNNGYNRYNFTFRNTTELYKDVLTLDVGASYVNQSDLNMTNQGRYSNPLVTAYLFPRGDDWDDIKLFRRFNDVRGIMEQYWPQGFSELNGQNPYWINYCNLRENKRNRYIMNANFNYYANSWLSFSARGRLDNAMNKFTEKFYATSNETLIQGSSNGLFGSKTAQDKQFYGDLLANVNKTVGKFSIMANIGASISDLRYDELTVRGPIKEKKGIANLFTESHLDPAKTAKLRDTWHDQTQSVFASLELGYKGAYYLTMTGRNDWPSQLAGPNSKKTSFFYPSIGGSVVLSELIDMDKLFPFFKIRASYASVGLPFARFLAQNFYAWNNQTGDWESKTHYPMGKLKPERTDSYEVGVSLRFLNCFKFDASYYHTMTYNQTFDPKLSVSAGYSTLYVQTGSVKNQGFEVALGYNKNWKDFRWTSNLTASSNKNKITELVENFVHPETGEVINKNSLDVGGVGQAHFVLKKGGSLGDLYSFCDVRRDENNNVYVSATGDLQTNTTNVEIKLGSVLPKANLAWRNDFEYKGFNFGFMLSARIGGIVYSATQAALDYYGVSEASAQARDAGGVYVDRMTIDPYKWYSTIGGQDTGIPQFYTYEATNVRLQEANIGYTVPRKKLGNVVDMTISIVGKNLLMLYCQAPFDPEAVASTGNYYQGIDNFMMPSLRNVGLQLRFKF